MRTILAVLFAVSLAGCPKKPIDDGPGPSASDEKVPGSKAENPYGIDIVTICMATETTPKAPGDEDPSVRATAMAKEIAGRLKTDKGKQFFSDLIGKALPLEKGKLLRAESKATGGGSCPLADWYEIPRPPIQAADPAPP